ncbi:MAG: DUF2059 domain-containing protein [Lentisphaeria bacterium]|nr:DUF2059 domain-containing protein [Lentisphaeria bacterium]NQZ68842.1 DUF2059 domain-containing protein [Lentisphaeria bacterium]
MKKMMAIAILFLSIITVHAEEETERTNKVVFEYFKTMKMATTYQQTIEKMLDLQMKQNPNLIPLKDALLKFFDKYMGWESIKNDLANIYMKNFSDAELKELIIFYKTPTGQKAALLVPTLATEGAELGQRRVRENMAELQEMIRARMAVDKVAPLR